MIIGLAGAITPILSGMFTRHVQSEYGTFIIDHAHSRAGLNKVHSRRFVVGRSGLDGVYLPLVTHRLVTRAGSYDHFH